MVNIYGINIFNFFNSYTKDVIIYILNFFGFGISVDMDQRTIEKTQPTFDLLNKGLASFLIKCLYTPPNVADITIYHKAHIWIDGSFAHGEHDPESIYCMSHYSPRMSQALKDHIWAQLNLGYMTK